MPTTKKKKQQQQINNIVRPKIKLICIYVKKYYQFKHFKKLKYCSLT